MSYKEQLQKRYELLSQADDLMKMYIEIADNLYRKNVSEYAGLLHMNIDERGIEYEYYRDNWDYSAGRSSFFVSVEKLDSLVDDYKIKIRKKKLIKLSK